MIIVLKFLRITTINDFLPMNDKVLMCIVASLLAARKTYLPHCWWLCLCHHAQATSSISHRLTR